MDRKVRVISISGQPLSGKSTVIGKMKENLIEKGIKDEDIHVVSVGNKFREYFNKIMDLAKELKDKDRDELKQIPVDEELQELCSNQELRQEMKQALIKLILSEFDLESFDIEKANNSPDLKEIRDLIDTIVDTKVAELGKEAIKNNRENEVWIMDSRLAFSNIPDSFAVRLTVRDDVAGERLFAGTRKRGKEDNNYKDVKDAMEKTIKRGQGEERRYKERYGIELSKEDNYNLIVDTSFAKVDDIADVILKCEELERQGEIYSQKWISPKQLLPMQKLYSMIHSLPELQQSVKKHGYYPYSEITTIEKDGRLWAWDGHHRIAVAAVEKIGLIPYHINTEISEETKKQNIDAVSISALYDFEDLFEKIDGKEAFYYDDIYPGIYKEMMKKENKKEER